MLLVKPVIDHHHLIFYPLQENDTISEHSGSTAPGLESNSDTNHSKKSNDEDETTDDDDDTEPKLTYDRVGNDVANVMRKDTATCLTLYERVSACV